jgi:Predicted exonuclease of the beta-lactamase fold involved in RNA processing
MEKIIFKRVLHPVGQGAFFSEQFFDDQGNSIFNVAYDCGTLSPQKHLQIEIENTFNLTDKVEAIDVLFISHLDKDHISGLDYLVRLKCLTDKSVVVLPLNYPLVLKMVLQGISANGGQLTDGVDAALLSLFESGAKILGINNNEEFVPGDNAISMDEELPVMREFSQLNSMETLRYRNLWFYLPFNTILDDNRYKQFLDKLAEEEIDRAQLTDIIYVQKNLPKLKEIYQNLTKGINGVTSINVNSLNLLSYCSRGGVVDRHSMINYYSWWRFYHRWQSDKDSRCSCLYTGDCVMEKHFERCLDLLARSLKIQIGMLQIPHHGRQSCYNMVIADREDILSGFTNFDSTDKKNKFVKQIVHDFSVSERLFFQITEDYHSRLEMYVHIEA